MMARPNVIGSTMRMVVAISIVMLLSPVALLAAHVQPQSGLAPGDYARELRFGDRTRTYTVHVPARVDSSAGLPVVVMLHGGGGNAQVSERVTGFSDLADEEGFLVVYPNGTGRSDRRLTWNAAACCAYAHDQNVDDVGFIDAMLDAIAAEFSPDMSRVYLTGHSNGSMMTYRLGCELAERFAAIAPVAGALNDAVCEPAKPLPVLILHGENDENVPFAGGASSGSGFPGEDERIDRSVEYAVETWVGLDSCTQPGQMTTTDSAVITTHSDCASGVEVQMQMLVGWGHAWPSPNANPPAAVDASQLIWEFVSRF